MKIIFLVTILSFTFTFGSFSKAQDETSGVSNADVTKCLTTANCDPTDFVGTTSDVREPGMAEIVKESDGCHTPYANYKEFPGPAIKTPETVSKADGIVPQQQAPPPNKK